MCKNAGINKEIRKMTSAKTFLCSVECGPGDI